MYMCTRNHVNMHMHARTPNLCIENSKRRLTSPPFSLAMTVCVCVCVSRKEHARSRAHTERDTEATPTQ